MFDESNYLQSAMQTLLGRKHWGLSDGQWELEKHLLEEHSSGVGLMRHFDLLISSIEHWASVVHSSIGQGYNIQSVTP